MFRITEDPLSGRLVQCLAKNYENDSIVSVDMDKVGVMATYSDSLCLSVCVCVCVCSALYMKAMSAVIYSALHTHARARAQPVRIFFHNNELVHVNGHDRIILVIFSQALYKSP